MSGNVKDKIVSLLTSISRSTKDENELFAELLELLIELRNITVFDGLQLFLNYIENKNPDDTLKIQLFLYRRIDDLAMFSAVYNYIDEKRFELRQAQERQESVNLSSAVLKPEEQEVLEEADEEPMYRQEESLASRSVRNDKLLDDLYSEKEMFKPSPSPPTSGGLSPPPPASAAPKPPPPASVAPSAPPRIKSAPAPGSFVEEKKSEKAKKKASRKSERSKSSTVSIESMAEETELVESGKRGILIDYYSRMNINSVYDFTVKIDKEMLQARKKQSDLLTGEQREQLTDEITVVETTPIEIELQIPGCLVTPSVHYVSPEPKSTEVSFYVTPYVKFSKKMGKLVIGQDKLNKKTITFNVNAIDRRIMKIISILGLLLASLPSIWPILFNVDLNSYIVSNASYYMTFVTNTTILPLEVGFGGLITLFSLFILKFYSSKRSSFTSTQPF